MQKISHCTGETVRLQDEPQKIKDVIKGIIEVCSSSDLSYKQINTALYHADEVLYENALNTKI